jgi:hypothetical protein
VAHSRVQITQNKGYEDSAGEKSVSDFIFQNKINRLMLCKEFDSVKRETVKKGGGRG